MNPLPKEERLRIYKKVLDRISNRNFQELMHFLCHEFKYVTGFNRETHEWKQLFPEFGMFDPSNNWWGAYWGGGRDTILTRDSCGEEFSYRTNLARIFALEFMILMAEENYLGID